jgi:hypothetical protein
MCRDFSLARTPLGIVAAVFNRGFCPYIRFFRGKARPVAAPWMRHLEEIQRLQVAATVFPQPLCKAVSKKVYPCEPGLCPFLAAQQQNPGVMQKRDCLLAGDEAANPIGVGCVGF